MRLAYALAEGLAIAGSFMGSSPEDKPNQQHQLLVMMSDLSRRER
jgi:hypothetical protein